MLHSHRTLAVLHIQVLLRHHCIVTVRLLHWLTCTLFLDVLLHLGELLLQMFIVLGLLHLLGVGTFDLLLETFVDLLARLEPIAENVHDVLDVFGLDVARDRVVDFELAILLVEFAVDEF